MNHNIHIICISSSLAIADVHTHSHRQMHSGTETKAWKEYVPHHTMDGLITNFNISSFSRPVCSLLVELGYRLIPESQSRAVSVIHLLDDNVAVKETDENTIDSECNEAGLTQEQLAEITFRHAEEMKKIQAEYE